jgi:serine/threonine protein kinase
MNIWGMQELMRESVYDMLHQKNQGKIPFKKRMKVARECCLGMNYLHTASQPILHLDLKTQNLLINDQDVTKVAGTATLLFVLRVCRVALCVACVSCRVMLKSTSTRSFQISACRVYHRRCERQRAGQWAPPSTRAPPLSIPCPPLAIQG